MNLSKDKVTEIFYFADNFCKEFHKYRFQTKTQLTIAKIDKILDTGCGSPVFFLVCD